MLIPFITKMGEWREGVERDGGSGEKWGKYNHFS